MRSPGASGHGGNRCIPQRVILPAGIVSANGFCTFGGYVSPSPLALQLPWDAAARHHRCSLRRRQRTGCDWHVRTQGDVTWRVGPPPHPRQLPEISTHTYEALRPCSGNFLCTVHRADGAARSCFCLWWQGSYTKHGAAEGGGGERRGGGKGLGARERGRPGQRRWPGGGVRRWVWPSLAAPTFEPRAQDSLISSTAQRGSGRATRTANPGGQGGVGLSEVVGCVNPCRPCRRLWSLDTHCWELIF